MLIREKHRIMERYRKASKEYNAHLLLQASVCPTIQKGAKTELQEALWTDDKSSTPQELVKHVPSFKSKSLPLALAKGSPVVAYQSSRWPQTPSVSVYHGNYSTEAHLVPTLNSLQVLGFSSCSCHPSQKPAVLKVSHLQVLFSFLSPAMLCLHPLLSCHPTVPPSLLLPWPWPYPVYYFLSLPLTLLEASGFTHYTVQSCQQFLKSLSKTDWEKLSHPINSIMNNERLQQTAAGYVVILSTLRLCYLLKRIVSSCGVAQPQRIQ